MTKFRTLMVMALTAAPGAVPAQQMPMQGHAGGVASVRPLYEMAKGWVVRSAEQMPEADYAFRPTPEVRTFGQLLGHVANASYMFCSYAKGEKNPSTSDFEKTTSKAGLVQAVKDALTYCDGAYQISDMKAMEEVTITEANSEQMLPTGWRLAACCGRSPAATKARTWSTSFCRAPVQHRCSCCGCVRRRFSNR